MKLTKFQMYNTSTALKTTLISLLASGKQVFAYNIMKTNEQKTRRQIEYH